MLFKKKMLKYPNFWGDIHWEYASPPSPAFDAYAVQN